MAVVDHHRALTTLPSSYPHLTSRTRSLHPPGLSHPHNTSQWLPLSDPLLPRSSEPVLLWLSPVRPLLSPVLPSLLPASRPSDSTPLLQVFPSPTSRRGSSTCSRPSRRLTPARCVPFNLFRWTVHDGTERNGAQLSKMLLLKGVTLLSCRFFRCGLIRMQLHRLRLLTRLYYSLCYYRSLPLPLSPPTSVWIPLTPSRLSWPLRRSSRS